MRTCAARGGRWRLAGCRLDPCFGRSLCGAETPSAGSYLTRLSRRRSSGRANGTVTVWQGDHLAVRLLGLTLWDLWGSELA